MSNIVTGCHNPDHPSGLHLCSKPPMTAPSETPLTENLQKLADDISVKCGVATVQAAIRIYLRQLAPHAKEREGGMLLKKSLEQMERYLSALAASRSEADKQRHIAANAENMAAQYKTERNEALAECERLRKEAQEREQELNDIATRTSLLTMEEMILMYRDAVRRFRSAEAREREAYERAADKVRAFAITYDGAEMDMDLLADEINSLSDERREG